MSEEIKTDVAAAEPAAKPEPAPQPKIDIEAIKRQAVEDAKKAMQAEKENIRKEVTNDIARKLTGEPSEPEINPLLKHLLTNTDDFLTAQHQTIIDQVERRMTEKSRKANEDERVLSEVAKDYPELTGEHLDYLDLVFTKLDSENPDKPRAEKIKEAAKQAAKKLKLKPLSEREVEDNYLSAAFPSSGGASWGKGDAPSPAKSAMDFIQGRKAANAAIRGRKAK